MEGFEEWKYPYHRILIDEKQGEVIGLWSQVSPAKREDGTKLASARIFSCPGRGWPFASLPIFSLTAGSSLPAAANSKNKALVLPKSKKSRCHSHFKCTGISHELGKGKAKESLPNIQINSYPVQEKYGLIWVFPGDPALADKVQSKVQPWYWQVISLP
jgi:hypothetical protein